MCFSRVVITNVQLIFLGHPVYYGDTNSHYGRFTRPMRLSVHRNTQHRTFRLWLLSLTKKLIRFQRTQNVARSICDSWYLLRFWDNGTYCNTFVITGLTTPKMYGYTVVRNIGTFTTVRHNTAKLDCCTLSEVTICTDSGSSSRLKAHWSRNIGLQIHVSVSVNTT